jgi:hypothetical protein
MSKGALIMMLVTQISFVVITAFFFFKVLTKKPNAEPDSFSGNDELEHEKES